MSESKKVPTAKEAAKAEVDEREMVEFSYDGVTYAVDKKRLSLDIDLMEAFEQGQIVTPLKMMLGTKQYATFRDGGRTLEELAELADVMFKALGINVGE